jgi:endo-1,4-beta-D-glucanase Y
LSQPARDVIVVALALAVLALFSLSGCGGGSSTQPTGTQGSQPTAATPQAAARSFLDRYVTADGRVQRIDQGGDTVGEGQAYGMLLAAAIGDAQRFDAIWGWTKRNLRRSDGLISFLWRDGRVQDPNAASDADLDAVRALLVAACRFHRPGLRKEALDLAKAIMKQETVSFQGARALVAGPWARKQPITVNPSYFSPATFAALQAATGNGAWGSLSASSRTITAALMPSSRLPPDWAKLQGDNPLATGPPSDPQAAPAFGFDAPRTLVRMAEDPDPAGQQIAAGAWPVFAGQDPAKLTVQHDLTGKPLGGGTRHPIVLVAAAGAAAAAGQTAARDRLLAAAAALDKQTPTYYGAAWVALGRIMLTTKLLNACS